MMKVWLAFMVSLTIVACATSPPLETVPSESNPVENSNPSVKKTAGGSEKLVKSPHGYVINGSTERFGGFIGDCASDENFPLYWECQEEIGGDSFN